MAAIITVMAFSRRPPAGQHCSEATRRLSTPLIYMMSFTVIGIYWREHHHPRRLTTTICVGVMGTNPALVFCLSLVPVVTRRVRGASNSALPAVADGVVSLASAPTYFALVRAIARQPHDERLPSALGRDVKGVVSPFVSSTGVALAVSSFPTYARCPCCR
jgi:uncharacterized membrane protein